MTRERAGAADRVKGRGRSVRGARGNYTGSGIKAGGQKKFGRISKSELFFSAGRDIMKARGQIGYHRSVLLLLSGRRRLQTALFRFIHFSR